MTGENAMTVAELREALEDAPDDAPVAYHAHGKFEYVGSVDQMEPLRAAQTTLALEPYIEGDE